MKIHYDRKGNTLSVWFDNPRKEYVCEGTGGEVVLVRDRHGKVIGFEKLNFLYVLIAWIALVGIPFSAVWADMIYQKDGRIIETTISYHDREETFGTVSEGIEVGWKNEEIAKIEPSDLPLLTRLYTDPQYGLRLQGPADWTMLVPDIQFHKQLTGWTDGQRVRFYKYPYRSYLEHTEQYDATPGTLNPALSVMIHPASGWTALAYAEDRVNSRGSSVRILLEPSSATINGNEWTVVMSEFEVYEMRVRSADYVLLKHGTIYWLSAILSSSF